MSSIPDMDLDLENLFRPAWAQGKTEANRYEKFTGSEGVKPERRRGDRREQSRGESFGERRSPRPPRSGGKFGDRKRGFDRRERERAEPPAPLPEITVTFLPDEKGVESLARQIKMTGRAYPLFQIAELVLEKPERYAVLLAVKKKPDGAVAQRLVVCALDDTPWLSEEEAMAHVLKNHFATFYQAERTATEPPKGTYTFVAQCGMSGVILGPPNHHDYQNRLRKLHADRFARMPFDVFKARVKIVKDEAVVKKWVEEQSFKTEYVVLNVPEPLKLPNLEEVEKHFRATHKETIIKPVESHRIAGVPSRNLRNRELQRLVRTEWEQQRHFPLQLATELSRQFATHGLQFFKVNKTFTHVSVARPQFLDLETTPVSETIKRIIAHINAHPKCSRRQLVETLAPTPPPPAVIEIKLETEAPPAVAQASSPVRPDETHGQDARATAEPTPEQNAIIADLHWLVHQGHVIEFADGRLETAKKPAPRPPKPEKKPVAEKPVTEGETISTTEPVSQAEVAAAPVAEAQTLPGTTTEIQAPAETPVPAAESVVASESVPAEPTVTPPDETTEEAVESPS
ncbi:MAG TPA: hypothetical protein VG077_19615 [Verrucomicrobiae bacterium]|nr:hypothetical protein [Verrucomicrobiae bacterium]